MIPVAKPVTGEEEVEAVRRPLMSGWVTQGPEVDAFEREFAAFVEAPYAVAVSNCTTALHLALRGVGVEPGDEVITVSHSFIATANAVRYCGAVPVFVDVDPNTFNMDPSRVERLITERTRAILVVHQVGMPANVLSIAAIAQRHGLSVVEDAACAVGSEILVGNMWEKIGKPHGDVACFSFHPRKLLTTGDGGMLTTRSAELNRRFRLWRQHSMGVSDTQRHASSTVIFEEYSELGFNYRLTDLQAAVGRVQLERLPGIVDRRRARADRYRRLLGDIPGLRLPVEPPWARSNWQSFCVRLPEGVDQRAVMQSMLDTGVSTRRAVMCAHREPAYMLREPWSCGSAEAYGCDHRRGICAQLTQSARIQDDGIVLPLYDQMTNADQDTVARALLVAVRQGTLIGA